MPHIAKDRDTPTTCSTTSTASVPEPRRSAVRAAAGNLRDAELYLRCLVGRISPRVFALRHGTQTVGRSADADVRLLSASISRLHAAIEWRDDMVTIENLSRTNPITINGLVARVEQLRVGDRVTLGGVVLELCRKERGVDI